MTTTRWQHSVVLTRKMQRSGNSMRIALTAPQQQQQHNGDDDANAIMQWHLSFMIIDCAPLWRWLMLEVAMVFVIVGGCIFFRRRQWRPLTTATARVDKGKGGLGRGDEGVPAA